MIKHSIIVVLLTIFILPAWGQKKVDCKQLEQKTSITQIIKAHTKAMGGKKAWKNLKSYQLHQTRANGNSVISSAQKPDKMRYDFTNQNGVFVKAYDGKKGWLTRNGVYSPMRPGEEIEMAEEPEFYEELIFAKENKHHLELLGMELLDDKCVYKIQMIKSEKDTRSYWLDADTYLISMTGEYSEDPAHEGIYYKTTFSDFRSVDGLMFPFKMKLIPNDQTPIEIPYDSIKINVVFEPGFFKYSKN